MRLATFFMVFMCLGSVNAKAAISASVDMTPKPITGGSDAWQYDLTLNNTGDTGIATLWYAWDDSGLNFLTQYPDNIISPKGWYGYVTSGYYYDVHNNYVYTYGIEWYNYGGVLDSGNSLTGFSFQTNQSPTDLNANSDLSSDPIFPVGTSFVYDTFPPQQDPGFQLTAVPVVAVPEPGAYTVAGLLATVLLGLRPARFHFRTRRDLIVA